MILQMVKFHWTSDKKLEVFVRQYDPNQSGDDEADFHVYYWNGNSNGFVMKPILTIQAIGQSSPQSAILPTASTTSLGGVKVDGSTITINGSGVISSSPGGGTADTLTTARTIGVYHSMV